MRLFLSILVSCLLLIGTVFSKENPSQKSTLPKKNEKQVCIMQIVEHPALNESRRGIEDELKKANVRFQYESAQGNPALASQIAQKFVGNNPAVMVGIGTTAAQALVSANQSQHIPIVFTSVTDPLNAKLVNNLKNPEDSVTGVSDFTDPDIQINFFKKILPTMTTLGVIYNPGESNSVALVETMKQKAAAKGLKLVTAVTNSSADVPQATQSLIGKVDAIFINNDNTALSALEAIINIAKKNKIPVFCSDVDTLSMGILAAVGPNQYAVGQQTGQMIIEILNGKNPKDLPVAFPNKTEIYINLKSAKELGITIPSSLLQQATGVIAP